MPLASTTSPWPDVLAQLMIQMTIAGNDTSGPAATAANRLVQQLRRRFQATRGDADLAVCVSYAHGDEKPEKPVREARICPDWLRLKNEWDPWNLFQFENGLADEVPLALDEGT